MFKKGEGTAGSGTYITVDRKNVFYVNCFCGLECVGHSFAYVAHFGFFSDVWILTQRAAVASRRATNLATHPPWETC